MYEKKLKHAGVKGMKWGHRKKEDEPSENTEAKKAALVRKNNAEILKKNPNAAVVDYSKIKERQKDPLTDNEIAIRDAKRKKVRNIAIGVGAGLTIAAGAYLYATHKKEIDGAIGNALGKVGNKKIKDVEPGSLSKEQIKTFKKFGLKGVDTEQEAVNANWIASWIGHDEHRYDAISSDTYNALDDNDISLKPGQIIKRLTKSSTEVLRDGAYVSFEEDDNNRYAAFLPAMWKVNGRLTKKPDVFSMTMEAVEEIKSPSKKKRVDILADLIKEDSMVRWAVRDKGLGEKETDPVELAKKYYNNVAVNLMDRDNYVTKRYFERVKELGYNALVDDNDAGRLTKTPLILLKSSVVSTKEIKSLTKSDITDAVNKIKPLAEESIERSTEILNRKVGWEEMLISGHPKLGTKIYYDALYKG